MESEILSFGGKTHTPAVRRLRELEDVIFDRQWYNQLSRAEKDRPVYLMYRDLSLEGDEDTIKQAGLRYDITVIPPQMLGREYVKTLGHYHPQVPGTSISYPEIYEVLKGEAIYLLQNSQDALAIRARMGDIVVIPPGYGHITINPTNGVLRMANWVDRSFSSVYAPIQKRGGGAYYLLEDGWKPNPNYPRGVELRETTAKPIPGLKGGIYDLLHSPGQLAFLTRPQDHKGFFKKLI